MKNKQQYIYFPPNIDRVINETRMEQDNEKIAQIDAGCRSKSSSMARC